MKKKMLLVGAIACIAVGAVVFAQHKHKNINRAPSNEVSTEQESDTGASASSTDDEGNKANSPEDSLSRDQIIYAMLMNQLQYSLQIIQHYKNKAILEQEYDTIICKIDKTKLKDEKGDSIVAYSDMLTTLTSLKLDENEKLFIKAQAEKEKSEAMYKSLSSLGTSAGVAIASFAKGNPAQAVAGLLYAGVSTAFNYRSIMNDLENQADEAMFKLEQNELKTIDGQRNGLFVNYAKFITTYNIPKQYEIKEDQMRWLVEKLDSPKTDANEKANMLSAKKDIFAIFPPFWYELGAAYQEAGDTARAKACYAEFEKLKKDYSIIDNDSYYTELAKNMIQILMAEDKNGSNRKAIEGYLEIIEKDGTVSNESENRLYLATIYAALGNNDKALKALELIIIENHKYVLPARELYELILASSSDKDMYRDLYMMKEWNIEFEKKDGRIPLTKTDVLAFSVPRSIAESYSMTIKIDNTDFTPILKNQSSDRWYYSTDYPLEKLKSKKNTKEVSIILANRNKTKSIQEMVFQYHLAYFDEKDITTLKKAHPLYKSNKKADKRPLATEDIFSVNISELLKTKDYEKAEKAYLESPYMYNTNISFLPKKSGFFSYQMLYMRDAAMKWYGFSKYGDIEPTSEREI